MNYFDDKHLVMSRLPNLKPAEEQFKKISVKDAYTLSERNLIKYKYQQAQEMNVRDNTTEWKVRGSPKWITHFQDQENGIDPRTNLQQKRPINRVNVCMHNFDNTTWNSNSVLHERHFHYLKLGTINIRTGDKKSEGAKLYMITKEVAKAGLTVCCMQEVRYRKTDSKEIRLNNGEVYEFFWSGYEKKT